MKKNYLLKAAFITSVLFASASAFAEDSAYNKVFPNVASTCEYPPLVLNMGGFAQQGTPPWGTENTKICVDVPVALDKVHVLFNLDTNTVDGNGNSVGLKHLVMLGTALKDRIDKGLLKPKNVEIVAVMHGSAAPWAIKTGHPGSASDAVKQQGWMNKIFDLKKAGINIQLEICGVTMMGSHWTKDDLYTYDDTGNAIDPASRIYVNQGAIVRIIDLEQHGFAYIHEAYEDHDKP
jgi:intracellular sulfur oxidation DsrE/DsrF family protein